MTNFKRKGQQGNPLLAFFYPLNAGACGTDPSA